MPPIKKSRIRVNAKGEKTKVLKASLKEYSPPKLTSMPAPTPYRWRAVRSEPQPQDPPEIDAFGREVTHYEGGTLRVVLTDGNEFEIRMEKVDGVNGLRIRSVDCGIDVQPAGDNQVYIKPQRRD